MTPAGWIHRLKRSFILWFTSFREECDTILNKSGCFRWMWIRLQMGFPNEESRTIPFAFTKYMKCVKQSCGLRPGLHHNSLSNVIRICALYMLCRGDACGWRRQCVTLLMTNKFISICRGLMRFPLSASPDFLEWLGQEQCQERRNIPHWKQTQKAGVSTLSHSHIRQRKQLKYPQPPFPKTGICPKIWEDQGFSTLPISYFICKQLQFVTKDLQVRCRTSGYCRKPSDHPDPDLPLAPRWPWAIMRLKKAKLGFFSPNQCDPAKNIMSSAYSFWLFIRLLFAS